MCVCVFFFSLHFTACCLKSEHTQCLISKHRHMLLWNIFCPTLKSKGFWCRLIFVSGSFFLEGERHEGKDCEEERELGIVGLRVLHSCLSPQFLCLRSSDSRDWKRFPCISLGEFFFLPLPLSRSLADSQDGGKLWGFFPSLSFRLAYHYEQMLCAHGTSSNQSSKRSLPVPIGSLPPHSHNPPL